jgi:hypothetical protein
LTLLFLASVPLRGERQARREHVARIEAWFLPYQLLEAADEQSGAEQQDGGGRHL